jgi:hypothetical protein
MFAILLGFLLALICFGLPLGIIGLFIASILDQKSHEVRDALQDTATLKSVDKHQQLHARDSQQPITVSPRYRSLSGDEAPRPLIR